MKIVICEDELLCVDVLSDHIKRWARKNGVFVELFVCVSAEQFLFDFEDLKTVDLIFLDIKLGKMDGIELAHKLRNDGDKTQIVFTTNSKEYVFEGYNVLALNYLMKPIKYEKCCAVLNQVRKMMTDQKYYICKTSETLIRIPYEEILFIEMCSHNATITTVSGKYITRKTMTDLIAELDGDVFMKCHKSYIVNIQHVSSISQKRITLSNNSCIEASIKYAADINKMYVKYHSNRR